MKRKFHFVVSILPLFMIWYSPSVFAQQAQLPGKVVDGVYVVESRMLDTLKLAPYQKALYLRQLKALHYPKKKRDREVEFKIKPEIKYGKMEYTHVNGDYFTAFF